MPYTANTWVQGSSPLNATRMNNLEQQFGQALKSFNADLVTPFVLSGLVASKDSATANKLNVTAGVAYLTQADGNNDLYRIAPSATSFTTATPSATYYLDLQPDTTWSWATSHSAQANYLPIAQVTTDGSGNINGVTDKRTTTTTLLAGQVGSALALPTTTGITVQSPGAGPYAGQINGVVTGGQSPLIVGSQDSSAKFDGSTGYIATPSTGLPTGNNPWSLEVWANLSAYPAATHFFKLLAFGGQGTNNTRPAITIDSGGALRAEVWGNTTSGYTVTTLTTHHIVATWDGTTLTLFVDGASRATATPGALNVPSTNGLNIGADVSGNLTDFYNGYLDEVAIYNAALTPTQVSTHYTRGTTGPSGATTYAGTILAEPALLRYYRLDDTRSLAMQATSEHAKVVNFDGTISPIAVASVGGQPTVGMGVPVIVAQALGVSVASTGFRTILSTTIPATGVYRVNATVSISNGGASAVALAVHYTDAQLNLAVANSMAGPDGVFSGTGSTIGSGAHAVYPETFYALGGAACSVTFQDLNGTPNDAVSVILERLA